MTSTSVCEGTGGSQTARQSHDNQALDRQPRAPSAAAQLLRYLGILGVAAKFGISERTAHKLVAEPWFPAPVQLVGGSRGIRRWVEQEIDEAVAARAPRPSRKAEPIQFAQARANRAAGEATA